MFKFNFSEDSDAEKVPHKDEHKDIGPQWMESKCIMPGNETIIKDIFRNCEVNSLDCKNINVKYFSTVDILNILRTTDDDEETNKGKFSVLNADQSHSDLQTAVYEGGLKVWECTFDLIDFIVENDDIVLKNKKILDLGCGVGLVGLLGLKSGASSCIFQDYNSEVLQYVTIPNVSLNDESYLKNCNFYSGDWETFTDLLNVQSDDDKFDFIFTCETIYNVDNYGKLHYTFEKLLKNNGEIYLAAKSYYFGVGGGVSLFEDFLRDKKVFTSTCSWTCLQGVNRQILKIVFA